jgi:hypothetical protein
VYFLLAFTINIHYILWGTNPFILHRDITSPVQLLVWTDVLVFWFSVLLILLFDCFQLRVNQIAFFYSIC